MCFILNYLLHIIYHIILLHLFLIFHSQRRCIDDSGGYLYHDPIISAHIVASCACLHNLAISNRMPMAIPEHDEDPDGQRPMGRRHLEQPPCRRPAGQVRQEYIQRRQQFIDTLFTI